MDERTILGVAAYFILLGLLFLLFRIGYECLKDKAYKTKEENDERRFDVTAFGGCATTLGVVILIVVLVANHLRWIP